jgi:hypothetical protein
LNRLRSGKQHPNLGRLSLIQWRVECAINSSKTKIRYAVVGLAISPKWRFLPAFQNASNSELPALDSGEATKLTKLGRKYSLEHLYS